MALDGVLDGVRREERWRRHGHGWALTFLEVCAMEGVAFFPCHAKNVRTSSKDKAGYNISYASSLALGSPTATIPAIESNESQAQITLRSIGFSLVRCKLIFH